MNDIAAIVLAAGDSSRLGKPKQLLRYRDESLITALLNTVLESQINKVIVVLGAHADLIESEIEDLPVLIIKNQNWKYGISSSIRTGIQGVLNMAPLVEGTILLVSDQPFVSVNLLNQLTAEKRRSGKGIIACSYDGTVGTPVLFDNSYFKQLGELDGKKGAKQLIEKYPADVEVIPFPLGHIDIDTQEDYNRLRQDQTASKVK